LAKTESYRPIRDIAVLAKFTTMKLFCCEMHYVDNLSYVFYCWMFIFLLL